MGSLIWFALPKSNEEVTKMISPVNMMDNLSNIAGALGCIVVT